MTIKPQISEGGTVKLSIFQESSAVVASSATNASGPTTTLRTISTTVLVEDGAILALGGLIQDTVGDTTEKVTGLGDIPVIGNLFKYQTSTRNKTNLMVFLRPTVIRNADDSNNVSLDRYDYMRTQMSVPKSGSANTVLPEMEKGKLMSLSPTLTLPASKTTGAESK